MLSEFAVQHFKSFESLNLKGLRPINVVVGQSAAGKTSLLEALRIGLSGQPQALWNLLAQRGSLMFIPPTSSREQTEALWGQYFYNFDIRQPITFQLYDETGASGQVAVHLDSESHSPSVQELPGLPPVITRTSILTVDRTTFSGETSTLRMHINTQGGVQFDQGSEIGSSSEMFPSNQITNSQQAANWFSALSIANRERSIVNTMRDNFNSIDDLSVQAPNGLYSLHATVKHMSRKIPINSVSAGITKFVSVLLAIEQFAGGYVMLDEIENGIYYELFPPFWRAISDIAIRNRTQIFVTTHSLECLRGLAPLLDSEPDQFNLLQVYQVEGQSRVNVVPGEDAAASIETGIEVRS